MGILGLTRVFLFWACVPYTSLKYTIHLQVEYKQALVSSFELRFSCEVVETLLLDKLL